MSELTNHDINLAVAETEQFLTENKVDRKK